MRIYLDDERPTPPGWERAYWPQEVIKLLEMGGVVEVSLDHDLGDDEKGTGYDVVLWVEEAVATRGFVPPRLVVHSANSSARQKMERGIAKIAKLVSRRSAFLRFDGASRHQPRIDRWFDTRPADLGSIARAWFEVMRQCGPDVTELLHDGHPTACVGDAAFGYVNVFRLHVNIGFFHGASLPDPAGVLEGDGRFMRHVKAKPSSLPDEAALRALVQAAYADIKVKLAIESPGANTGSALTRGAPDGQC